MEQLATDPIACHAAFSFQLIALAFCGGVGLLTSVMGACAVWLRYGPEPELGINRVMAGLMVLYGSSSVYCAVMTYQLLTLGGMPCLP